jgi:hypothetical protein
MNVYVWDDVGLDGGVLVMLAESPEQARGLYLATVPVMRGEAYSQSLASAAAFRAWKERYESEHPGLYRVYPMPAPWPTWGMFLQTDEGREVTAGTTPWARMPWEDFPDRPPDHVYPVDTPALVAFHAGQDG